MERFRVIMFTLALAGLVTVSSLIWAETPPMSVSVTGQVVSLDSSKHELTIRDEVHQDARTFRVLNPDVLKTLKPGDRVKVNTADEKTAESISKP